MNDNKSKDLHNQNIPLLMTAGRPPYRDVAEDVLKTFHPNARCAFISGSITRGQGTATSDIDLAILYGDDFTDIHRDTIIHQGWLVELFVHNEQAQNYFFDKDIKKGTGTMVHMVATGIPIGPDMDIARTRQQYAQSLINAGPPAWDPARIDRERYFISCELDDLSDPRPKLEQNGSGSARANTLLAG